VTGSGQGRPPPPFDRSVLRGPTLAAAGSLLGARLVRDAAGDLPRRVGRVVEVEAYIGVEDRASHARMGPTPRNHVMFGPPGIAYVYLVYGMHNCLNVVTEPESRPAAILIRAVEPLEGIVAMRTARIRGRPSRSPIADARLAAGPGLVCAAFDIDRSASGVDLCDPGSPLRLESRPADEAAPPTIGTPRVGVSYAGEPWASVPWRLIVAASPSLSRPRG
jgi:DNA-3-methyladenine glycosylase